MSHRTLLTAANVPVQHIHYPWEYDPAQQASIQNEIMTQYPGIQPVTYVHLDHHPEDLLPTLRYNCWGFTFNPRQCWINSGQDVQNILDANGFQVTPPNLRVGDVACYRDEQNIITHTGRVWGIDAAGQVSLIQSKWGAWGEYFHPPNLVPQSYGTNITYWRVTPLKGKGDALIKDNYMDDRLPYPFGTRWLSPDLWCNNLGGMLHHSPIRGQINKLFVRVHNVDTLPITDAKIRVYWADPTGGIPHTAWHDIGSALVSVPPGMSVIAGPIKWSPESNVPDHTCLFAIADTGDDPCAASTLDPIVWPFDIDRDNNMIQKNVSIIKLWPMRIPKPLVLPFTAINPYPLTLPVVVRVEMKPVDARDLGQFNLDLAPFQELFEHAAPTLRKTNMRRTTLQLDIQPESDYWRSKGGRVSARGMELTMPSVPTGKGGRLKVMVSPTKNSQPGQVCRIDLEQRVGGTVTGGMTYIAVVCENE